MTSITRRNTLALTGSGLMAALTASAVTASAAPSASPIRVLFDQWQQLQDHLEDHAYWRSMAGAESDEKMTAVLNKQTAIWHQIIALPIRDPGDLAMKVVVAIGDPEADEMREDDSVRILADARAVIAQSA